MAAKTDVVVDELYRVNAGSFRKERQLVQLTRAFFSGWKTSGENNRILLLYYFANLLFAIVAAAPLYLLMQASFNFRLAGSNLAGQFDLGLILEFIFRNNDFLTGTTLSTAGIALIYSILAIFLAGGAIATFVAERRRYDAALFWGNCGYYFSTFLRLIMLALPFYGMIIFVVFPALTSLLTSGIGFIASDMRFMAKSMAGLFSSFLFAATVIIFDYVKVSLVVTGERFILDALAQSLKAFSKHFLLSLGFISVFSFLNLLIYLLYSFLSDFLQAPTIIALIALAISQQIFIIIRLKLRLTYYASLVVLYPRLFYTTSEYFTSEATTEIKKNEEQEYNEQS
ncbi:MAG: hypothetical protein ACE5I1_25960 [bacterium]